MNSEPKARINTMDTKEGGHSLRAGAAVVDITPTEFPVNMPGGFRPNMAEGAHDPLHARAIVIDDGTTTIALVIADNLGVVREAVDKVKALAADRCGIAPDRILVASTHSHTAPHSYVVDGPSEAVAYHTVLVEGVADAIVKAHAALRPAAIDSITDDGPLATSPPA